ncbi:hypothetical protein HBI18_253920 [Parastagonospora nodorum]|nr:hypothetical protein HBI28_025890 [Parastagonospora nodorum]KAH5644460.1 hypothetical protein HBI22_038460 [Parastagonospora nodorum]KAH5706126.1 hypothetical protein HBI18_253920 [Parastagonospora nodorum]
MVSHKINADDIRNPSYYRLRAGYPEPDLLFYEGRKNTNEPRQHVVWSKENFVRGYNLTCGEFYRFRQDMAPLLMENRLYKQNLKDTDKKWDLFEAYEKAHKHPLLQKSTGPMYWKRKMIAKFFTSYLQFWLEKHDLFIDPNVEDGSGWTYFPRSSSWAWPRKGMWKFDGYFQYQHMKIRIQSEPDSHDRSETICELRIWDILDPEIISSSGPTSHIDVDLERCILLLLQERFKTCPHLQDFSEKTHDIRYRDPDSENKWFRIYDDSSLINAITMLRKEMDEYVYFFVFEVDTTTFPQQRGMPKKDKRRGGQRSGNANKRLRQE